MLYISKSIYCRIKKMGIFNKKEKEVTKPMMDSTIPKLPELPSLNSLPSLPPIKTTKPASKLPSYPSDSLGKQFSQNSIKNAVTGDENEDFSYNFDEDEYDEENEVQEPSMKYSMPTKRMDSNEPVFIRIDKFESSLKTFEKTKKQITEIESTLRDLKKIQDEEAKELEYWQKEILSIKEQIEKIDREVFSKLE